MRKQARGAQRSAAWRKEEGGSARGGRLSSVSMRQRRRHLREELEERLERRGLDELLLEFRAIKGGERAQRAVERHVLRRGDVGEDGVVLRGHLEELASGELVLFVLEVREAGGDTELRDQLCIVVGGALRLGDVVGHVREVAHLQCGRKTIGISVYVCISSIVFITQLLIRGIPCHCRLLSCCPHISIYSPLSRQGFSDRPSRR